MSRRRKVAAKLPERSAPDAAIYRESIQVAGLAVLWLATVLIYRPAWYGTRLWDDDAHITRADLQSIDGLYRIWFDFTFTSTQQYYPLLHSAFWLEHKLWGDSVLGYHLINVLLHMTSVTLLYFILRRLKIPGALLAAAIFAVHPVMVESVAWISEQKNTLSAVFYLSAMLLYLDFDQSRNSTRYFLALGIFVLGLLTKTVTATLPAALLVIFWWQRGRFTWKRDIMPLVTFFALGAAAGVLTGYIERKLIGAEGAGFELTFLERGLIAGRVVWFYLAKLLWPANLIFFYPRWQVDPTEWWQWLFPIATIGVLLALWTLRKKTRAPLAGALLFVGTLVPVLGFLNVFPFIFSFVADHFQYLASLGVIVLIAAGIAQIIARQSKIAQQVAIALCVVLVATLATLTFQQSRTYADVRTLYEATLARNPGSWLALNNLGESLKESNPTEAESLFRKALELKPDYPQALNNLGLMLIQRGQFDEAIEHLNHAIRIVPQFAQAHNNLGLAFYYTNKIPRAKKEFQSAISINPREANAHANLANLLVADGHVDEAIEHYLASLATRPKFPEVHQKLGDIYLQLGRINEAIEHYQAALSDKPDLLDVYPNLASALAAKHRAEEAISTAKKGIEIARTIGQEQAARRLEEWLKRFANEQQPTSSIPVFQRTPVVDTPTVSQ
jgi:protein O-mannosyl-transferase